MKRFLNIITFSLFAAAANAQEINPKMTFNVDLGLPVTTYNKPFNSFMQGLVCTNIYGQYSFPFHLNVAVGGRYSLLTVNEFAIPEANDGSIHTVGGYVKVGWDKFLYERFAIDLGVKVGYAHNFIETDLNKEMGENSREIGSLFFEPTVGLILSADDRNAYRLNIGYCIQGYQFNPQRLGFSTDSGFDPAKYGNSTQFIVFGFGYTHYFKNKKP